jgi:membrane protein DedA with SNARE-associated domain/rhodanese-related sulfurtransferase
MELPVHILLTYGYLLLFGWVLVEQLGVPLPAAPVLLAAGALSTEGQLNVFFSFWTGLSAALIADTSWFFVGRHYGHHVMRFLCKLTLEPSSCVRKTQLSYGKRRGLLLVFAKFVPGLATLAPPVAGKSGMRARTFLALDTLGSALWVGALLVGGRFFGDLLNTNPHLLDWVGHFSGFFLGFGIVSFLVFRLVRRFVIVRRFVRSRMEPHELKQQMDEGEQFTIVDLRGHEERLLDPVTLPGAIHFAPDDLTQRAKEIPRDRDVVLFCNCPDASSAASTAMRLHKLGLERARPLRGGVNGWREAGFPLESIGESRFVQLGD